MVRNSWKRNFGIKAYWIRFEFAPSCGQIHAHILFISSNKEALTLYGNPNIPDKKKIHLLEEWSKHSFRMSASIHDEFNKTIKPTDWEHSSAVSKTQCHLNQTADEANCQLSFQCINTVNIACQKGK